MLLAGDIGGTRTRLGLFERAPARPRPIAIRTFTTLDYDNLPAMVADFIDDPSVKRASIQCACFGVAGPVFGDEAELTNVPWKVDARAVGDRFGIERVSLLNDLQAMAWAVPVLDASEVRTLQEGQPRPGGTIAVIAAGTGLGEATLHYVGGRFIPSPSEGGHADFAARTEREIALLRDLVRRYGRAELDRVVSGRGLVNMHRITHVTACAEVGDLEHHDAPAAISRAALEKRCGGCIEALDMFVEAYAAEAGNLALRTMATFGVFIGGGIAPKILPALADGAFLRAFRAKTPLEPLLDRIPVKVMLNIEAGLLGAAVYAAQAWP